MADAFRAARIQFAPNAAQCPVSTWLTRYN
jgi:hypothetical protein